MGPASLVDASPAAILRAYVGALAAELVAAGVRHAVVCPGSRSTPLAIVLRGQPGLRVWTHLDERSASYFALGMAKALREPVAVLATSGTAAANFAPAVAEARFGQVPLLVLTADRPAELREVGATQTIDQVRMYGGHAKWSLELSLPEATPAALRYVRAVANRAVATAASAPAGPVHLNFPFREPLIPAPRDDSEEAPVRQVATLVTKARPSADEVAALATSLRDVERGVIVCGPQDDPAFAAAATRLARATGYPLLADALSQVRGRDGDLSPSVPISVDGEGDGKETAEPGYAVIDTFDAFLRHAPTVAALAPDVVLRFGATPVSKPLQQYIERYAGARQVVVADAGTWPDQSLSAHEFVFADATLLCEALAGTIEETSPRFDFVSAPLSVNGEGSGERSPATPWAQTWHRLQQTTRDVLEAELCASDAALSEAGVFRRLADLLPARATIFAGNSMPVRDLDSFLPARDASWRCFANRGASGIDGVVSTALGFAAVSDEPVVLVIGDISFYHDLNGLLAARRHNLNATIVLLNNDGGGIFSFLPQAGQADIYFEELFGTPHGLDFRHAAALHGLDYTMADTPAAFDAAVRHSLATPGVDVIEVRSERNANVALHERIWARVASALDGLEA